MFPQAYMVDKIRIGLQDVLWPLATEDPDQNGDDPFGDYGIAVRGEYQFVPCQLGMYPDTALAALDQVVVRLVPLFDKGEGLPEFYHVYIALHPVLEHGELLHDTLLYFLYCH